MDGFLKLMGVVFLGVLALAFVADANPELAAELDAGVAQVSSPGGFDGVRDDAITADTPQSGRVGVCACLFNEVKAAMTFEEFLDEERRMWTGEGASWKWRGNIKGWTQGCLARYGLR